MDKEQKPRLIDSLPLKIYKLETHEYGTDQISFATYTNEYVKVQDVENFLQKFTDPTVLNKIVKSLMFGQKLNFEDVLK